MLGAFWMLAWLGVSAAWQRRSFWTAENLLASAFYGADGDPRRFRLEHRVRPGALSAALQPAGRGCSRRRCAAAGSRVADAAGAMAFALAWYYLSFQLLWRTVSPLLALLHAARPRCWAT